MQKNYFTLTKELNILKSKLNHAPVLTKISFKDFLKYKNMIFKKELIEFEISKLQKIQNDIVNIYSKKNEKWLYDDNMNCRKYCKLEKKASYIRDKKLYKLGFMKQKPVNPILQNIINTVKEKIIEPVSNKLSQNRYSSKNIFKSILEKPPINNFLKLFSKNTTFKKINSFFKETVPTKLTTRAISGAKKCIIGYRNISNNLNSSAKLYYRNILSSPIIQVISYIKSQAKIEADLYSNFLIKSQTKKESDLCSNSFLSNIKVDLTNNNKTKKKYYYVKDTVSINHLNKNSISNIKNNTSLDRYKSTKSNYTNEYYDLAL
ncbi:MAG TPA: hypothetical protein PK993_01495 [Clostridia bacterium]|nr:hypothetical protein [Clostridia bacterium]